MTAQGPWDRKLWAEAIAASRAVITDGGDLLAIRFFAHTIPDTFSVSNGGIETADVRASDTKRTYANIAEREVGISRDLFEAI